MSEGVPRFHLQRVYDDGASGEAEIVPVLELPGDARMSRREFVGSGVTITSVVAALAGCAADAPKVEKTKAAALPAKPPEKPVAAHRAEITSLAFSPDGSILASAGGSVKLWSLPGAQLLKRLPSLQEATRLAITPDGRTLVSGTRSGALKTWSLPAGDAIKDLASQPGLAHMLLLADGKTLVTTDAVYRPTLRLYTLPAGSREHEVALGNTEVNALAASPSGEILIAGMPNKAQLLALPKATVVKEIAGREAVFSSVVVDPAGRWFATPAEGRPRITFWSLPDGSFIREHPVKLKPRLLAITPDGARIVVADGSFGITVSDAAAPDGPTLQLLGHQDLITALAISRDGRLLASGDWAGTVILWDLATGERLGFAFDPEDSRNDGASYNVYDQITGQMITYTLPCGSPIPAGATCICNCVPGRYVPTSAPSGTGGRVCTCNKVCTCVPVRYRSDRAIKSDLADVDTAEVLDRLARLPILEWRYQEEPSSIRHIGPMAQDFAAVFGVGGDRRTIHVADAHGVALASIQALHREMQEMRTVVESQARRIEALTGEIERIRGLAAAAEREGPAGCSSSANAQQLYDAEDEISGMKCGEARTPTKRCG